MCFVFMKNFSFNSPALQVFCKKMPYFSSYLWGKYFSTKIHTVLHQSKKELSDWDQNWAKTEPLLFKTFEISNAMDSHIVHCPFPLRKVLLKCARFVEAKKTLFSADRAYPRPQNGTFALGRSLRRGEVWQGDDQAAQKTFPRRRIGGLAEN